MYQCQYKPLSEAMQNFFGFVRLSFAGIVTISIMSLYPWGNMPESAAFGLLLISFGLFVGSFKLIDWLLEKIFYPYYYKRGILFHYTEEFEPFVIYGPRSDSGECITKLEFRDGSKVFIYPDGKQESRNPKNQLL